MNVEIRMELPLDEDGYLRRQCPRCERIFKWHSHSDSEDPGKSDTPDIYFCPYCGEASPTDQWLTDEQVDYVQALASIEAMRIVERELKPSVDRLNRSGGGLVKMKIEVPHPAPPPPLFEPDDMVAVEPPCHPEEPVKIVEGWQGELHCLICGDPFVVPADS